jgi:tetratricopeptide (TPR) repeat protein
MFLSQELLLDLENQRLLTRLDGKPKSSLVPASEKLVAEIVSSRGANGCCSPVSFVGSHNLGALFLFHAGEFGRAEEVCRHAIDVCFRLAEEGSFARWATHSIQPYLNLGRIAAARGKYEESVAIFRDVFRFVQRQDDLLLNGYRISSSRLDEILAEDPTIGMVGTGVYLADSVRAYLIAEDYGGLLRFVETLEADPVYSQDSFPYTIMEAKARALLGLNETKEALNILVKFVQRMSRDTVRYASIYTLIAEIYRRAAMARDAEKVLGVSESYMQALKAKSGSCAELLRTTFLIAVQQFLLGNPDRAALHARLALTTAQDLDDEAGQIKALILLLNSLEVSARGQSGTNEKDFMALYNELYLLTAQTAYCYEQTLGYIQLATEGGATAETDRVLGLGRARVLLTRLQNSCTGTRKQRLAQYGSLLEKLTGGKPQRLVVEGPVHGKDFLNLYEELLALEPTKIAPLMATA